MSQFLTQNSLRAGFVVNSSAESKDLAAKPAPTTQNSTLSLSLSATAIDP